MKSSYLMKVLADAHRKCGHSEYAKSLDKMVENFEVIEEAEDIANGSEQSKTD